MKIFSLSSSHIAPESFSRTDTQGESWRQELEKAASATIDFEKTIRDWKTKNVSEHKSHTSEREEKKNRSGRKSQQETIQLLKLHNRKTIKPTSTRTIGFAKENWNSHMQSSAKSVVKLVERVQEELLTSHHVLVRGQRRGIIRRRQY